MIVFVLVAVVFILSMSVIILLNVLDIKRKTENLWTISKFIHSDIGTALLILKNQEVDRTDSFKY